MSDEDVRERSPLHEAAPRDWNRIGIQTGGLGSHPGGLGSHPGGLGSHARGLSHGEKYRTRKGKRNERDSTASSISVQRPGTQFRGGTISTQSRPKTIHPTTSHQSQAVIIQHHPSSPPQSRNVTQFSTFNPYPGRNPGIGSSTSPPPPATRSSTAAPPPVTRNQATTAPPPATRSPALQSRKRSSNPSSPDISKKPTVPEKSPNLGKNCIFPRPSKLPIVSMYGASKQPCHEVKKVRKTSGDIACISSIPGGAAVGSRETVRRHELRHHRASPSNIRVGSPKRGDVRRAPSPTLPTWRRSPSSSRSRPSSPCGRAGSPGAWRLPGRGGSPVAYRPPSPSRATSPGKRRALERPGLPACAKGSRPPSPRSRAPSPRSRPPSPRGRPSSPRAGMKRHPSPSQMEPEQAECVLMRVGELSDVKLYLLQRVGLHSFLVCEEDTNFKYKVNIGPQTCSCRKGPGCLHLLFIMFRVFKLKISDLRLTAKVLKEYEIDSLFRTFEERRETQIFRSRAQSMNPSYGDQNITSTITRSQPDNNNNEYDALCPICLSDMNTTEDICTCSSCNNHLHCNCMSVWSAECVSQDGPVLCPLCRSTWSQPQALSQAQAGLMGKQQMLPNQMASSYQYFVPLPYQSLSRQEGTTISSGYSSYVSNVSRASDGLSSVLRASDGMSSMSRTSDTVHMLEQNGCPEDIPLPKNEGISHADWQVASTWIPHFSRDLVACLLSREWLKRETGLRRLAREIVKSLKSGVEYEGQLERCKCCIEILQRLLEDKVYKVYVAAKKALQALLNFYWVKDEAQFHILHGQLKRLLDIMIVKSADANKRMSEVSIETLIEISEGKDGCMGIGRYLAVPGFQYSGVDLILGSLVEDHNPDVVSCQWTLGRLVVLEVVLERLNDQFNLKSSPHAQTNCNRLMMIIQFAFQKLTNSHLKVAKMANKVITIAARIAFDDNTTFHQVWNSLEVLDKSLEIKLKKNIAAALEKQYGRSQESSSSSGPSTPSPQDNNIILETFLSQCSNKHCAKQSVQESASVRQRAPLLRSTSHSPSRMHPTSSLSTSNSPSRFTKAASPPLYSSMVGTPTNTITAANKLKMYKQSKFSHEINPLFDHLFMNEVSDGSSFMEVDQPEYHRQQNQFVDLMDKSAASSNCGGPITRSRSIQMEHMFKLINSQGLMKSGSCVDVMEYENGITLNHVLSRSNSEEQPLPNIPGLSHKTTENILSHPHKQVLEGVESRSYQEGVHWTKGQVLGTGAFSICYQARDVQTGTLMAAKQISFSRTSEDEQRKVEILVQEEISLMSRLKHPNIVRMFGAIQEGDNINVFEEWMPGGSIASLLDKHGAFTQQVIIGYTRQILLGIHYLHKNGILHRDIKGANLLVDTSGHHLRIGDFGAAARMRTSSTIQGQFKGDLQGTIAFMAPEVLRGDSYGRACDIWSLGCTIIEMATSKPPWGAADISNHLTLIFMIACSRTPPSVPEFLSPGLTDITLRCLEIKESDRPTSTDLLLHPLIQQQSEE